MKQPLILKHADVLPAILPPLLDWYKHHAADRQLPWRENPAPYHVWVSEIMLQQTRASAVIPYYERFLSALPDIAALAHADDEMLMKLWQGLGYYSRARNLKKAAQKVLAEYDGELPQDYKALLALPGIGRYTAGAIGSIAWGRPWPAIDGNVLRVTFRVMACREDILAARTRTALEKALSPLYPAGRDAADLNQAFMDLGASVCLPNGKPHCSRCPLSRLCLAHAEGREQDFPVKTAAKARRIETAFEAGQCLCHPPASKTGTSCRIMGISQSARQAYCKRSPRLSASTRTGCPKNPAAAAGTPCLFPCRMASFRLGNPSGRRCCLRRRNTGLSALGHSAGACQQIQHPGGFFLLFPAQRHNLNQHKQDKSQTGTHDRTVHADP